MVKKYSKPRSETSVGCLYEQFLNECIVFKKATATMRSYQASMKMLFNTMQGIENESIIKLDKQFSVEYTVALSKRPVSASTINHYLRDFRAFIYWCMENHYILSYKLKLVRETEQLKDPYNKDELAVLLRQPQYEDTFVTWRTWAMINWMLSLGSRAQTVISILRKDVDFQDNSIMTRYNKNGKVKSFPLNTELKRVLTVYLRHIPVDDCIYLFPNYEGEMLTYNAFRLAVDDYNCERGVEKTSIHLFRHTFGKMWAENGGSVYELQAIFDHSDIRTTQRYINLYGDKFEPDRMARLNPLEKLTRDKLKKNKD